MDVDAPFGPMRFRSGEFGAEVDRGRSLPRAYTRERIPSRFAKARL